MSKNIRDAVIAVLAADAFTLKAEWVYDLDSVDAIIASTGDALADHPDDGFQKGKKSGELTHYGDHVRALLHYLATSHSFTLDSYTQQWSLFFDAYTGYHDGASKNAFARLKKDPNALSAPKKALADTAGAAKFVPLLLLKEKDRAKFVRMAQEEAGVFYNSPFIADTIELAAYVMFAGLAGVHPSDALQAKDAPVSTLLAPMIQMGLDSTDQETRAAIQKFGNACGADAGISIMAHLIAKYKDNPVEAQRENLRGGGDISGRALLYTTMVAPYFGKNCVLQEWIDGLVDLQSIQHDIESV